MTGVVREMFADTLQILTEPGRKQRDLMERVMAREDLVDEMEREIVDHLTRTARAATSTGGHRSIASMIQNVHRLERVADHCSVLVRIAQRIDEHKDPLTEQEVADIKKLGALVDESLANVGLYLTGQSAPAQAEVIEQKIDDTRRRLRARMLEQMKVSPPDDLQRELGFLDAITHMEEIGDRAAGIVRHAEMMRRL